MKLLLYALAGVCGGVLAGMGMGGGTLTIPILVLLLSVDQLTAQFVNLIAFLPTGAAALGMHLKNKLVEPAALPYILIPRARRDGGDVLFRAERGGVAGEAVRRISGAHCSFRACGRSGARRARGGVTAPVRGGVRILRRAYMTFTLIFGIYIGSILLYN